MGAVIFVTLFLGTLGVIHYFRRRVAVGFIRRFDAIRNAPVYDAEAMGKLTSDVAAWVEKKNPTLGGTMPKDALPERRALGYSAKAIEIVAGMDPEWHRELNEAVKAAAGKVAASNAATQRRFEAARAAREKEAASENAVREAEAAFRARALSSGFTPEQVERAFSNLRLVYSSQPRGVFVKALDECFHGEKPDPPN
jgi:hypothetical protein